MATKITLTSRVKHLENHAKRGVVGYLILFVGMGAGLYIQRHDQIEGQNRDAAARVAITEAGNFISIQGCNRDFRNTQTLRGIIRGARVETQKQRILGEISSSRYKAERKFYRVQLRRLRLPDCRKSSLRAIPRGLHRKPPVPLHTR